MATVTRYINTDSTAGGDGTTNATSGANRAYASRSEWEADEQTDLVTDGDVHVVYVDGSADDTTQVEISGWTTGSSNTITMENTQANAHDGTPGDKGKGPLIVDGLFTHACKTTNQYVTLRRQWIHNSNTNNAEVLNNNNYNNTFQECVFQGNSSTRGGGVYFSFGGLFENCLAYGAGASNGWTVNTQFGAALLVNCVAAGFVNGFIHSGTQSNDFSCVNCVGYDNSTDDFASGTTFNGSSYNASSDSTEPGSNPITTDIVSGDFVDASNDDYHIAASGSTLEDAGVGPATDSDVPSVDIDGDARSGTTTGLGIDAGPAGGAAQPYSSYAPLPMNIVRSR